MKRGQLQVLSLFVLAIALLGMPSGWAQTPIRRTQERMADGKVRCYGAPKYYKDSTGFHLIDLTSTVATNAGKKTISRGKGVAASEIKSGYGNAGYLTLWPDEAYSNKQEELSFDLDSAVFNGVALTIDTGNHLQKDAATDDLGSLVIQQSTIGVRQLVKVPAGMTGDFAITFGLWAKALHVSNPKDAQGYYIPDAGGNFNFINDAGLFRYRIGLPVLLGADYKPPASGPYNLPVRQYMTHALRDVAGPKLEYVKKPLPAQIAAGYAGVAYVDVDTYYGTTQDGQIGCTSNVSWAAAHDATSGVTPGITTDPYTMCNNSGDGYYTVQRIFLTFDTTGATGVTLATLHVYGGPLAGVAGSMDACKGTFSIPLVAGDFDAYTGSSYGAQAVSAWAWNTWTMANADIVNGTTKIALREHEHDTLNTPPDPGAPPGQHINGYGATPPPYIEITAGSAAAPQTVITTITGSE